MFSHVTFRLRPLFWFLTLVSWRRPHAWVNVYQWERWAPFQVYKQASQSFFPASHNWRRCLPYSLAPHPACLSLPVWLKMVRDWDQLYLKLQPKSLWLFKLPLSTHFSCVYCKHNLYNHNHYLDLPLSHMLNYPNLICKFSPSCTKWLTVSPS